MIMLILGYLEHLIKFTFFPQAYELYKINKSLFFWFSQKNLHAVRYLIAYPAVIISNFNQITLGKAFTIYTCIVFVLIGFFFLRLLKRIHGLTNFNRILGLSLLMVLAFVMNGRLIYAFLGIILILDAEYKFSEHKIDVLMLKLSEIIGLILSMVSSGTMTVTAAFILTMNFIQWKDRKGTRDRYSLILINFVLLFPLLDKFLPYFYRFLIKNTDYYGGGFNGFIGAMQHGLGRFFYTANTEVYILIISIALFILFINILFWWWLIIYKKNKYIPLLLVINICMYGGVFGFSTGLLGMLPVTALILSTYCKDIKI